MGLFNNIQFLNYQGCVRL